MFKPLKIVPVLIAAERSAGFIGTPLLPPFLIAQPP
jgi:hypothetical protein